MQLHGKNIIGNSLSNVGASTFYSVNPANSEQLETTFFEATDAEIHQAVQLAEQAFHDYRARSKDERAAFLDRIADEILAQGDELLQRAHAESGLPLDRLTGERGRTMNQLKMFAALIREGSWVEASIDTAILDRAPVPKPDLRKMLIPLGPVAVFGASNFPLAFSTAGGDTASALAAGCPVVVKAHPAHPGTAELVATAIINAANATGMPEGVFSMVHGVSYQVSLSLVEHPLIKAVGFTGSFRGGKALFDAAARRPKPIPVYAEMGSVNPVFVLPGALRERGEVFAEGLKNSVTMGVGQFCTCPGLVVGLQSDELQQSVAKLASLMEAAPPATMLHSGILSAYEAGIEKLVASTAVAPVRATAEADPAKTQARAAVFVTTGEDFLAHPQFSEEIFGPSTVVVSCASRAELESVANDLHGHLTATIHGTADDLREYKSLVSILENKVGRLLFNGFPTGVEVCPSMTHGGPYPATTDSRSTSVGTAAIKRFVRPLSYQSFPNEALPLELQDGNPLGIWRLVNGEFVKDQ
ncbi:MAG TPA: aldehyde dehydrogenase (NADP(+)) [Blastocatellia bacterium]|nr:aldehyde dehydrogenase (NADP(+)) [Blastocatellia bacterium]